MKTLRRGGNLPEHDRLSGVDVDNLTGWWLDEYDEPRFRKFVNINGPEDHSSDPLATAEGPCWLWTGAKTEDGYGQFRMGQRMMPAHRIAWLDGGRKNVIPDGYVIDHLCRNTSCVNPQHLEPVTIETNVDRGLRGRDSHTECPNGHRYSEDNTQLQARHGRVHRYCKTCLKESKRRTYLKRKAEGKTPRRTGDTTPGQ